MRGWGAERLAAAAGAALMRAADRPGGPVRAVIDSRTAGAGDLFVGIPGTRVDGGEFAAQALGAGAWGVLVSPGRAAGALAAGAGAVLAAPDPVAALGRLARAWRREAQAAVVAVTGSTGKTSTKEILLAVLAGRLPAAASADNYNTEIGLPLQILSAPPGTRALVLEMAMRGPGQIAELTAIAEPDVGIIVNVGPAHLEQLGSLEAIAAAKAELIAGMAPGATAVLPAGEPLLAPHRRADLRTVTFGEGGDVRLLDARGERLTVDVAGRRAEVRIALPKARLVDNLLAALAAAHALGVEASGRIEPVIGAGRGERLALPGGVVVIDDCYNANPMSMRAALEELAAAARGRRVAVLGDMLELGPAALGYHRAVGAQAAQAGVDVLVTVGPLAAAMAAPFGGESVALADAAAAAAQVPALVRPGDTVLVKASNGVGLAAVTRALAAGGAY